MIASAQAVWSDPVLSAQATFRAIMNAMARPGSIQALSAVVSAPAPLSPGAAAVALTLFDHDTPVWLDPSLAAVGVSAWLRFHTGAPIVVDRMRAAFALIGDGTAMPPFTEFRQGTLDYPDRSATLVVQVASLQRGPEITMSGPGIRGRISLRVDPVPHDLRERLVANRSLFPRGVDLILVARDAVAAIPRSMRIVSEGG